MEEGAAPDVEMVRPTPSLNPRALILTCAAPQVSLGTTSGGESDPHPPSTHRSLAHRFPSPARTQTTPFISNVSLPFTLSRVYIIHAVHQHPLPHRFAIARHANTIEPQTLKSSPNPTMAIPPR